MKLLVIDGNGIMNRAFYGIRVLTNKKGMPTNALTGFLNIFLKLMKEEAPDRIAVAFDLHAPTFRLKMYADYKGTRHAMPDELRAQMPIIKQILTALGGASWRRRATKRTTSSERSPTPLNRRAESAPSPRETATASSLSPTR